jgi:nucleotide-binding universal stress UspA family protein
MRILLATDGSEHSAAAVDEIVRRHPPADTEVRVVSVVEPPYFPTTYPLGGMDMELYEEMQKTARDLARAAVEKAASRLREKGRKLSVTTEVLSGSPKRVILEDAEAFGADLIVVGSHGRGALDRFLLGSVSQAVALHAKCSVEIVRSPNLSHEAVAGGRATGK